MNKTVIMAGLWSSALCLASFIIWIVAFTGIAMDPPLFTWTDPAAYVQYAQTHSQFFHYLAKSFMIVFSLAYMVLAFVYFEFAARERQLFARLAVAFAILFALLSTLHYYTQISAVRFALADREYQGLEHFLQANPASFLSSANMLGWTLFLGFSSGFMFLAFRPATMNKTIRFALLSISISCIMAGIGYLARIDLITFVFINLGMGGAFLVLTISSIRHFRKLNKE